ncbi:RNase H domain [Fusarium albosuccineum]|uniref:ribonuclease H n=1 Tax=Fusarium albosuccineum TaxID=1237068 RepID=A0A8H4L2Z6_9HYPO|nr:RNase H domain [Fusarium albosuccineum]
MLAMAHGYETREDDYPLASGRPCATLCRGTSATTTVHSLTATIKEPEPRRYHARHINASLAPAGPQEHAAKRQAPDLSIFNFLTIPTTTPADLHSCSTNNHYGVENQESSEMNKKRSAPAATAASGSSSSTSKKRKMDGVKKYYAVRAGFKPGIYVTYAECQQQTSGFRGAVFKSFTSLQDAEDFVAGRKVVSTTKQPDKFYAVAVGSPTGIYTDWAEASEAIKGIKGPKYKRFNTRAEAVDYIRQFGNREAIEALGEEGRLVPEQVPEQEPEPEFEIEERPAKKLKPAPKQEADLGPGEDVLKIYTDGSSLANGKAGARAGLGVYFGPNDPRNLSERLEGKLQTNQRAELMAMQRALEIAPLEQAVQIYSDSQYSIKCVTQWALSWETKQWKTATGAEVKNQDIIRAVLAKMKERTKAGSPTYFQWVKGHASDRGNIAADRLAVAGANMSME